MKGVVIMDPFELSLILDKTIPKSEIQFPSFYGAIEKISVSFMNVKEPDENAAFEITGEIEIDDDMHPIEFHGFLSEEDLRKGKKVEVQYEVETKANGDDDDDDDEGEEWKRKL